MRTSMDDRQLLDAYARNRSEPAFAELVKLHLDWVYSVALRHVGDPHLAEDVVQSVFVLLARKARDLGSGTQVGGWLFRTTRLVAGHARRAEQEQPPQRATFDQITRKQMPPAGAPDGCFQLTDNYLLWFHWHGFLKSSWLENMRIQVATVASHGPTRAR